MLHFLKKLLGSSSEDARKINYSDSSRYLIHLEQILGEMIIVYGSTAEDVVEQANTFLLTNHPDILNAYKGHTDNVDEQKELLKKSLTVFVEEIKN